MLKALKWGGVKFQSMSLCVNLHPCSYVNSSKHVSENSRVQRIILRFSTQKKRQDKPNRPTPGEGIVTNRRGGGLRLGRPWATT